MKWNLIGMLYISQVLSLDLSNISWLSVLSMGFESYLLIVTILPVIIVLSLGCESHLCILSLTSGLCILCLSYQSYLWVVSLICSFWVLVAYISCLLIIWHLSCIPDHLSNSISCSHFDSFVLYFSTIFLRLLFHFRTWIPTSRLVDQWHSFLNYAAIFRFPTMLARDTMFLLWMHWCSMLVHRQ